MKVPMSLRKPETEERYQIAKKSGLLKPLSESPAIEVFKYWKLINNDFPYDMCFQKHHMLIPKRQYSHWYQMNLREFLELIRIMKRYYVNGTYDLPFFNFPKKQSVKNHFHIHLAEYYDERPE